MKKLLLIIGLALPFIAAGNNEQIMEEHEFYEVQKRAGVFSLETKINDGGITYKFGPLAGYRTIPREDIERIYIREFEPLREYGSWGIRYSINNGKAVFVKGNTGIQLELKNGKKLLIGTQNAAEAEAFISRLQNG